VVAAFVEVVGVVPLVVVADGVPLTADELNSPEAVGRCIVVTGADDPDMTFPPMRLPISVRRLLSSSARPLIRDSWVALCASSDLGMRSRRVRISSAFRRASSSRLRSASLRAETTASSSVRALSSRDVRASSASLRALVSVSICSMAVNALEKAVSTDSLSWVSCSGVGGLISGRI
jgi:hypothetical protein